MLDHNEHPIFIMRYRIARLYMVHVSGVLAHRDAPDARQHPRLVKTKRECEKKRDLRARWRRRRRSYTGQYRGLCCQRTDKGAYLSVAYSTRRMRRRRAANGRLLARGGKLISRARLGACGASMSSALNGSVAAVKGQQPKVGPIGQ